jgi:hypothetical protein
MIIERYKMPYNISLILVDVTEIEQALLQVI